MDACHTHSLSRTLPASSPVQQEPASARPGRVRAGFTLAIRGKQIRVVGNTHGLKSSQIKRLERLGRRRVPADRLLTQELARELTGISHEIRRQVGVLVDRRGSIGHVMVGDARSIEMPDWGRMRAGKGRLRGLRCIHTHLRDEGLTRDDLTDLALLRFDAMASVATDEHGLPGDAHVASLLPANQDGARSSTWIRPLLRSSTWTSRTGSAPSRRNSREPPRPGA